MKEISIIIPVYNGRGTIHPCIQSVLNQSIGFQHIELIIVDDCSTDGTFDDLQKTYSTYENIKLIQLESNSGSPSTPRNVGIEHSEAQYLMFLDADDRLPLTACERLYQEITIHQLDHVRGKITVFKGNTTYVANDLKRDYVGLEAIKQIIANQSTIMYGIYRKSFFTKDKVQFLPDIKIGEDTIVLTKLFGYTTKIKYTNQLVYDYYKNTNIKTLSSTQSYNEFEVYNHLYVWQEAEKNLNQIGLSYYQLRLQVALRVTLENLIRLNDHLDEACFNQLADFISQTTSYINTSRYILRINTLYQTFLAHDYSRFLQAKKKRLLIAGDDLKFTYLLKEALEKQYEVKYDQWQDHNVHSAAQSKKLLEWADIIWCEWFLGNVVWYSKNKRSNQVLFVRMHRFEIMTFFYRSVNLKNVDFFIAVSPYFYDKFIEVMHLDKEKCYLIPNAVNFNLPMKQPNDQKKTNIALIGSLPKRKGLAKAIELLKLLPPDYQLYILGKRYTEVDWIKNDPQEARYYKNVEKMIKDYHLQSRVHDVGWVKPEEMYPNIDYVLSLSDDELYPESFHLAPIEGLAGGVLCCSLYWRGVEHIYPSELIVSSLSEMASFILKTSENPELYNTLVLKGYTFCQERYNVEKVASQFDELIRQHLKLK